MSKKFYDGYHVGNKNVNVQARVARANDFTYQFVFNTLKPFIKKGARVLDVGCGVGTTDFFLASRGCMVEGWDISNVAITLANRSKRILGLEDCSFYSGDVVQMKPKRKYYDLIICSEVVEHVENDVFLLQFMYGALKDGGRVFLSTPLNNAPLYRWGFLKDFEKRVGHLRRYSRSGIESLMKEVGFKIESVELHEGVFRNMLYTLPPFGQLVKFARGPLVMLYNLIDGIMVELFGPSNIYLVASK